MITTMLTKDEVDQMIYDLEHPPTMSQAVSTAHLYQQMALKMRKAAQVLREINYEGEL